MSTTCDLAVAQAATVAMLTVGPQGIITGVGGVPSDFGISSTIVGRQWLAAIAEWHPTNPTADERVPLPCRFHAVTPNATHVTIEACRFPFPDESASLVALIRMEETAGAESESPALRAGYTALSARQQQLSGLGELAASVAHEINNALTLVHGWLNLLRDDVPEDHSQRPAIDLVIAETDRIADLTRNLLQVARSQEEQTQDVDLAALLHDLITLTTYQMNNASIELRTQVPEYLPTVRGSSGRLKQALLNLLVNARQAMPSGGTLTVRVERQADAQLCIHLEDTGAGIPEDVQSRVFSPFFTTKQDGTGLGLPVTRKIVEDHGGTLDMQSTPNRGTQFTLRLPVGVRAARAANS